MGSPNNLSMLSANQEEYAYFPLSSIPGASHSQLTKLPVSIRIFLEAAYRKSISGQAQPSDIDHLLNWQPTSPNRSTIPIFPGRVLLQDFTGVPVLNDLAAMRSALAERGADPGKINPVVPVDLVIDHSVQVDFYGTNDAFAKNAQVEFERNRERYEFIHWAQKSFSNLKVVPPASGIVHQVNLEYLAKSVLTSTENGVTYAYPDTLVGTDSHTTMINGLGVAGWGVGGIEAVAAMLGEPIEIVAPDVLGVRLSGSLPEGATPTDLTLTLIQRLRSIGVVDKIVEFTGTGLESLTLADRAMIANVTPETGATMLYFPVDQQTLIYLRLTGRPPELINLVEAYYKAQNLFHTRDFPQALYTQEIDLDLSRIEPSLAGPKRPQDRVSLGSVKRSFQNSLSAPRAKNGYDLSPEELTKSALVQLDGHSATLEHGSVVIAAITSCTNTSDPFVMIGAGLLAQNAVKAGLQTKPFVKTSLAPGSRVVLDYLQAAGLLEPLEQLGFQCVAFGCTTCIGNSGPLSAPIVEAVTENNLVVAAVLSGNRNFEGRISPQTRANYLASPPLVVAYALAGSLNVDLVKEPLGIGKDSNPVYLRDIWPKDSVVQEMVAQFVDPEMFKQEYATIYSMNDAWNKIESGESQLYTWMEQSTYLQKPPFFDIPANIGGQSMDIIGARVLAVLGDSITTDHISPAGSIAVNSPAGKYLLSHGVKPSEFNSYGSRRGNDRVMTRGTFANIRLKNLLTPGVEGGVTLYLPTSEQTTIFEAAERYAQTKTPLIVLAGKEYGTGSSRDWAAKGVLLLGVKAVIAESFERIHRSNLAGMGVLPLQFLSGENSVSHSLTGKETFTIKLTREQLKPGAEIEIIATNDQVEITRFKTLLRLDTAKEVSYYLYGGIMNAILAAYAPG